MDLCERCLHYKNERCKANGLCLGGCEFIDKETYEKIMAKLKELLDDEEEENEN